MERTRGEWCALVCLRQLVREATLGAAGFGEKRWIARIGTGKVEEPDGYLRSVYRRKNNKTCPDQARVFLLCAVVYNEMSPSNAGVVYLRSPHQPRSSAPQFPGLSSLGKLQI